MHLRTAAVLFTIGVALALIPSTSLARGGYDKCPGTVKISSKSKAVSIRVDNMSCKNARHVIKRGPEPSGFKCKMEGNTQIIYKCKEGKKRLKFVRQIDFF